MPVLIDWAKVNELRDDVGADDFGEVVDIFLTEVDSTVSELGQPDRSLEHDLHFLKGSASNLGFVAFSGLCRDGETLAASGSGAEIDLRGIVTTYRESKEVFLSELSLKLAS